VGQFALLLGGIALIAALAALWLASESSRRIAGANQGLIDAHLRKAHEMVAAYDRRIEDLVRRQTTLTEELKRLKGETEGKIQAMDVTLKTVVQENATAAQGRSKPRPAANNGAPTRNVQ
jgi:hypothetical protein